MVHSAAETAAHAIPWANGVLKWIVEAAISGTCIVDWRGHNPDRWNCR